MSESDDEFEPRSGLAFPLYFGTIGLPRDEAPLTICQGCGAVRAVPVNTPHACWRNEDGTYEEGGTFQ